MYNKAWKMFVLKVETYPPLMCDFIAIIVKNRLSFIKLTCGSGKMVHLMHLLYTCTRIQSNYSSI